MQAKFDIDFTTEKKDGNINILVADVKEHLVTYYTNHLKVFTDGSVFDSNAGCGFVIPALKIQKSFSLGKNFSIFTAELYAILMALTFLSDSDYAFFNIVLCVDSKSVLYSLQDWDSKIRKDLLFDIRHMIHYIMSRGTGITFCWVPSHCGIYWNERADKLAKQGAMRQLPESSLKIDVHEINSLLEHLMYTNFIPVKREILDCSRYVSNLIYKMRLNSWKTKFSQNVACACSQPISFEHIFFQCPIFKSLFEDSNVEVQSKGTIEEILNRPDIISSATVITRSVINVFL